MLWTIEPVGARQSPVAPPALADMASAAALESLLRGDGRWQIGVGDSNPNLVITNR
jgi:hypothetical protein